MTQTTPAIRRAAAAAPTRSPRTPRACVEPLEARQHLSVSQNEAGFTVVTPEWDSKVVYVSSSGSDLNNGLSPSSPVKTLGKAQALVRNGMPDQVLLNRGDRFSGSFGYWKKSGRGTEEPMVIGAYGTGARPQVRSGTATGITVGNTSARQVDHLAILGIEFYADARDPVRNTSATRAAKPHGIDVVSATQGLLIEDCKVSFYQTNVAFVPVYGDSRDATFRRNVVTDSYHATSNSQGLFADGVRGLILDSNTFDHNGWLEGKSYAKPTTRNHNAYVTGNTSGLIATGNTFANAGSHGMQARSGGVVARNLFVNNPIGLSFGVVNGDGVQAPGGVSGTVWGNVFLGGRDIAGQARGQAIEVANTRPGGGTTIRDNVFAQQYSPTKQWAISLIAGDAQRTVQVGLNDLLIENNVTYKFHKGLFLQYGLSPYADSSHQKLTGVRLRGNTFSEITSTVLVNTGSGYVSIDSASSGERSRAQLVAGGAHDPDRNVASYSASIGGPATTGGFLNVARGRAGGTFDARYAAGAVIAHVRDGFGMWRA